MGVVTQLGNYVKFLRGTPSAYEQLQNKDSDTLYFVAENNADHGILYLGDKLISGGITSAITLSDLEDVLIGAGVEAGSLLYYDGNHWINKSLAEIFEVIVGTMVGASATQDGKTGLVTAPLKGQQNLYLKGDATWGDPTASIAPQVQVLSAQVGTLIGNDTEKSVRIIASEEVNKIVDGAPAAFDTLREIAEYIVANPGSGDLATRLQTLETIVISPNTGLQDKVTIIEATIGNLEQELQTLREVDEIHDSQIAQLQIAIQALKWQRMVIV